MPRPTSSIRATTQDPVTTELMKMYRESPVFQRGYAMAAKEDPALATTNIPTPQNPIGQWVGSALGGNTSAATTSLGGKIRYNRQYMNSLTDPQEVADYLVHEGVHAQQAREPYQSLWGTIKEAFTRPYEERGFEQEAGQAVKERQRRQGTHRVSGLVEAEPRGDIYLPSLTGLKRAAR